MSFLPSPLLQRQPFHDPAASPEQQQQACRLLRVLLAQDGSATRLCEALAGAPVALHLWRQTRLEQLPAGLQAWLPGQRFLERITSLSARGEVMTDNLSYIALDGLDADLQQALEGGQVPIGHLLPRLWVRRSVLSLHELPMARLWSVVGLPDPQASRAYRLHTPNGPCMVIAETCRRGLLMPTRSNGQPAQTDCPVAQC